MRSAVKLIDEAVEDIRDLDGAARKLVFKALIKLETSPEQRGAPLGSNSAIGNLTGLRKLVVGDRALRVIYDVRSDGQVVVVWVVGRRVSMETYDLASARLALYESDPARRAALTSLLEQARAITNR